ncbi:MAG TPA: acetylxylan esterase [Candidatus Avipropionibacterium avicola]|uniref:Acetylxylan esterase n=1 Tax=Candidatus Avipropionibacterium avicola TaxID=2840701 RepID=A0A9D1KME5_9ACTN|nr:acetylxylan esterase [Candidatus Avipropionibacterium avicola]
MQGFGPNLDGYADPQIDLERYVQRRTQEWIAHWQARDSDDPATIAAHGERVRRAVLDGVGGLPQRPAEPPELTVVATTELGPGRPTIDRVTFESLPGVVVTATLYRPVGVDADHPGPAVLFAHGHSFEAKGAPHYQSACQMLADAGLTVLAVDPCGQGERVLVPDPVEEDTWTWGVGEHLRTGMSAWWAGHSLMRWMVTDLMAGVDVLCALPQVDPARIGMTGASGGGTQTTIMMALEPRLAAAAPATYVTSRAAYQRTGQIQDGEQHLLSGTARGVDHADLLIAFAPKPVRVLAAAWDFFVPEGTQQAMERAERAYAGLGALDAVSMVVDDTIHAYSPGLQRAATEFFCDTFDLPAPTRFETAPLPNDELAATTSGQVIGDDPATVTVIDLVNRELDALAAPADPTAWLAERVFADRQLPPGDHVRWIGTADEPHLFWNAETDLWGAGVLLDPSGPGDPSAPEEGGAVPLTLVLLPDGTATPDATAVLPPAGAGPRVVLDLRGTGALAARQRSGERDSLRGHDYKLLCDLLWLGDSLAAGRVFDLCRAIDVLTADRELRRRWPGLGEDSPVELVSVGRLSRWYAELAARVHPRIRAVHHDGAEVSSIVPVIRSASWVEDGDSWQGLIPGAAGLL